MNLCFEFGIELEEMTTTDIIARKEKEGLTKVLIST